ncbi:MULTISPECIES: hypothetical protein [unclassified Pseudomonas]|nr:hypothetical protein [Pseudomonas sp. M47T1]
MYSEAVFYGMSRLFQATAGRAGDEVIDAVAAAVDRPDIAGGRA